MSILFIGGVCDGERLDDPGVRILEIPIRVHPIGYTWANRNPDSDEIAFRRETYQRHGFRWDEGDVSFYAEHTMTLRDALIRLIQGYSADKLNNENTNGPHPG